ncbi:MAG: hypothetical protein R2873_30520 [Caldilineaceae bacterium]
MTLHQTTTNAERADPVTRWAPEITGLALVGTNFMGLLDDLRIPPTTAAMWRHDGNCAHPAPGRGGRKHHSVGQLWQRRRHVQR